MDRLDLLVVLHSSRFVAFIRGDAVMPAGLLGHQHLLRAAPAPTLPCATTRVGSEIQVFG
jgi:hypothetical protein